MSPAYGFSALALVKCSNEGGPGPRHNMKEDPGTSTLIMKREHGQEVPCDPGQEIRSGCEGAIRSHLVFSLPELAGQARPSHTKSHLPGHSPPASQAGRCVGPAL